MYTLSSICSKRREKQLNRLHSSCGGLHSTSYRRKAIPGPPGEGGSGIRGGGFDKNVGTGLGGNSNGNNKGKNFLCPNCGNVCTQIEEFLCEFTFYSPLSWRPSANPFFFISIELQHRLDLLNATNVLAFLWFYLKMIFTRTPRKTHHLTFIRLAKSSTFRKTLPHQRRLRQVTKCHSFLTSYLFTDIRVSWEESDWTIRRKEGACCGRV